MRFAQDPGIEGADPAIGLFGISETHAPTGAFLNFQEKPRKRDFENESSRFESQPPTVNRYPPFNGFAPELGVKGGRNKSWTGLAQARLS